MQCEHSQCTCQVGAGEQFCSDYCRSASEALVDAPLCECGHPECAGMDRMNDDGEPIVLPPR